MRVIWNFLVSAVLYSSVLIVVGMFLSSAPDHKHTRHSFEHIDRIWAMRGHIWFSICDTLRMNVDFHYDETSFAKGSP